MIKMITFNGSQYHHSSVYLEKKKITKQYLNNILHGKKYKKRYKSASGDKVYNYVVAPKFKKGKDYIVRDGHIYICEDKFPDGCLITQLSG